MLLNVLSILSCSSYFNFQNRSHLLSLDAKNETNLKKVQSGMICVNFDENCPTNEEVGIRTSHKYHFPIYTTEDLYPS